jgi:hypothetical protein
VSLSQEQPTKNRRRKINIAAALSFAGLVASSCSTPASKPTVQLSQPRSDVRFDEFSQLPLGISIKDVFSRFGDPLKAYFSPKDNAYGLVYRNVPTQPERYFLWFDHESKKLISKTYEPLPTEKENSYQEVQAHFKGAEFYSPPVSMCGSHYARNEGLVYIWGTGVTLDLHPKTHEVMSISWGPVEQKPRSPAQLPDGCPHGRPVPAEAIENPRTLL